MKKPLYENSLSKYQTSFVESESQLQELLELDKLPSNEILKIHFKVTNKGRNKLVFKLVLNKDIWIKLTSNKNHTYFEKIIYAKNWYGPKKISYRKSIFFTEKNKYHVDKIEWFYSDNKYLKVRENFINMLAAMEGLEEELFYLPHPPESCQKILDNYFLISENLKKDSFKHHFTLGDNLQKISDNINTLSFKEMVANSKTRLPIQYFHEQENKDLPDFGGFLPTYILNYKTIIQSKSNGDPHDVVLTNIYFHLFNDQKTSIFCVRYKIDDTFIVEFNPQKNELKYKQILISNKFTDYDNLEDRVTITLEDNVFPVKFKRILLPKLLANYGLPRIFEFNPTNSQFKNKMKFKQGYKTQIIKKLYRDNVDLDENYRIFAHLLHRQKNRDTIDEVLAIAGDYKNGIDEDTKELLVMNYQELVDELPKSDTAKVIFNDLYLLIQDYSEAKNREPSILVRKIQELIKTFHREESLSDYIIIEEH